MIDTGKAGKDIGPPIFIPAYWKEYNGSSRDQCQYSEVPKRN